LESPKSETFIDENPGIGARKKRTEMGFTLIELLIVIGILAVLAAVAIPAYSRFFGSGEVEANATELSHLQNAMDAMLADNRINLIEPQTAPTNDFSALPEGAGTESLYPAFLRSNITKCVYTWKTDGVLTQTNCSGGGSEVSPPGAIAALQDQVTSLVDSGSLAPIHAPPLLAKLNTALQAIEDGNSAEAMASLTDFINQVDAFVATGKLSGTDAQPLIDTAEALLQELNG